MTSLTPSAHPRLAALLSLAALCASATAAPEQPAVQQLPRVVVEGRAQLLAVCPGADEQIQSALLGAVWRKQIDAVMPVRFTLQGTRVSEVQVGDGPMAYAVRLRHAVGSLQCSGPQAGTQVHEFSVALRSS